MKNLEKNLAALRARADQLNADRGKAQAKVAATTAARQKHRLEGDLSDTITSAELLKASNEAQLALSGFDEDIAKLATLINEAETDLNDEKLRAICQADAKTLTRDVDDVRSQLAPWLVSTRKYAATLDKVGPFRFEMGSVGRYLANAANEVETAMAVGLPDLEAGIIKVAEGSEALPKSGQPQLTVVPKQESPPTEAVFLTQHICWTEDGERKRAARFTLATLSPKLAARARELVCCVPITDPMVKTHSLVGGSDARPTAKRGM
jgi:hypothetical protein